MTQPTIPPELLDQLRTVTAPTGTADVIPITQGRRVRRWDEPQPPDPYPERPTSDQGVRQRDHADQHTAWESKNGLPVTEPVVDPATPPPGRVTADRHTNSARHPFAATTPTRVQRQTPRLTWWAVALSVVAQTTVTTAIQWGNADPLVAACVSVATLVCSLLLIAAEQITGRNRS